MSRAFQLPDLGEGIHEGEVIAVHVEVGQRVEEGDTLLEVETDKAAVDIPSPFSGTVEEIHVQAGDVVTVGDVLVTVDTGEEDPKCREKGPSRQVVSETPTAQGRQEPAERARGSEEPAISAATPAGKDGRPVPASPATRRVARELGVDLRDVKPSGPGGLVTSQDVRSHAEAATSAGAAPEAVVDDGDQRSPTETEGRKPEKARPIEVPGPELPDFSQWGPVERVPFRSIRRATARRMALSWSQIPHVNTQDQVDVTLLEALRRRHKDRVVAAGGRLTLTVFVLKAVSTALGAFPNFNASLDTETGELIRKRYCNIGVAVDTEDGLIVPVVRDVDRKSIRDLSVELHGQVEKTRNRKVSLEEMQGGSFTITNAGALGGGFFSPIINFPEVAILGMGRATLQPVVVGEDEGRQRIEPRRMLPLVLCVDHRVLDGADAIRFLQYIREILEDPEEMLLSIT